MTRSTKPWTWIPTLYFAQGIPYVVVMSVAVVLYKRLGISNTEIALYTSWLYLPWVIKPLWSPFVDLCRTRRFWIVATQLLLGAGLAGIGLTIPAHSFFRWTLAIFWLLAFASATHDIAADGFYMLALSPDRQAFFVGIRSTFYRIAMICGQGLLLMVAGLLESGTGPAPVTFTVARDPQVAVAAAPDFGSPHAGPAGEQAEILLLSPTPERLVVAPTNGQGEMLLARVREHNRQARHQEATRKGEKVDGIGTGGVALVRIALSAPPPPGTRRAVTLDRHGGSSDFRVILGERLLFDEHNWRGPALALVQVDHRLRSLAKASFQLRSGNIPLAWSITFYLLAGLFTGFALYHRLRLPRPADDRPGSWRGSDLLASSRTVFLAFFKRPDIGRILAFLLIYRLAEAQLVKLTAPFLLDAREAGGLGLSTGETGFIYGTVGVLALTLGGILGGVAVAARGLGCWLLWMVAAINLPDAVYLYLAWVQPESLWAIGSCVAIEQFGYGFGFTAYMLFMIHAARGEHRTAHYAIATGFMALGMMIPGMWSGWIQERLGYPGFFTWVLAATIPCFLVAATVRMEAGFGRRS